MGQSVSLPAYMYIPKPIKQQLAAYHLGTLLEVYKRGWRKDGSIKVRILMVVVVMLAIGVVSSIGIFNIVQTSHILVIYLLLIPGIAFIVAFQSIPLLFKASLCVCAFSEGLVYAKNTQVAVLRWNEIEHVKRQTKKGRNARATLRLYTVHARDGRIFKVEGPYLLVDDLGKIISERIA